MKIIVSKYLNARQRPSTAAGNPFYRTPGDILDIDDITAGTEIAGNSIWYHCSQDGCYYWSGGTAATDEILPGKVCTPEEELAVYSSAVNELSEQYHAIPGFKGLGAGYKETGNIPTGDLSLIFYVTAKQTQDAAVPAAVNYRGILLRTDVRALGDTGLLHSIIADARPPYYMGGSISELLAGQATQTFGSRTMLVERNQQTYLLTCYHVACFSLFDRNIYQSAGHAQTVIFPSPKVSDGPNIVPQHGSVADGMFSGSYDYALLKIEVSQVRNYIVSHSFSDYYRFPELSRDYLKNLTYIKYGAKTEDGQALGFPTGRFRAYNTGRVQIDTARNLWMSGLVEVSKMSDKGDSGAPVLDTAGKLVGYIVADGPESTFILPFAQLEINLGIKPKIP